MKDEPTKAIPVAKPTIPFIARPWGSFKQFASNRHCTVNLMTVMPGKRLSLQSHTGRAELWIVIDEGAVIQVGDTVSTCRAGDEFWIPPKASHRLSCRSDKPVRVLEVSFGDWQQEDITRYADDYGRQSAGTREQ